jgi:hypothetical protein
MESSYPHSGITMHAIKFGGGVAGAIFAIGSMLIFLIGIPALWVFLAGAIAVGAGFAVALRQIYARFPGEPPHLR